VYVTTADELKPVDRDVIREAKAELREGHNRWLRNNTIEEFYGSPIHSWRVDKLLEYTRPLEGRVLDVGCFVGEIAERIERQGSKSVVGMDCLEAALEITANRGIETVLADIDEAVVPFENDHFDVAVAADVLTEVYDPDAVVEELARVVRPGGTMVFTVPNLACAGNRALLLLGRPPYNLEVRARSGVGHLRLFTRRTFSELLEDHGLEIVETSSSVFVWPIWRFSRFRRTIEYRYPRWAYSKWLARFFPTWGENIIVLARRPLN
jgi:2-polyprenyl-3-methyl-5-hydroxy-6-metoxy-1,4-benzoquinol methylase